MRSEEFKRLLVIIIIGVALIGIIMITKNIGKNKDKEQEKEQETSVVETNGVKQVQNDKIKQDKKVGGLKFSQISIQEQNGVLEIRANVTNETGVERQESPIKVNVKNEKGEVLQTVGAYVGKLKSDETRAISASVNMSIDEIYDIEFEM